jgi:hypothetical protein
MSALQQPVDDEYEVRADGMRVRKDRWQVGIRRIVAILWGNRKEFEIDEVVQAVCALVPQPFADGDDEALVRAVMEQMEQEPPRRHWRDMTQEEIENCRDGYLFDRKPEQEPVAYLYHDASTTQDAHPWLHSTMLVLAADRRPGLRGETPLYTHLPRREWRGLTEGEMEQATGWSVEHIEAKLKERNA